MSRSLLSLATLIALVGFTTPRAQASTRGVERLLEDALDEVKDADKSCRRAVKGDLKDLLDDLDNAGKKKRKLKRVLRALEDLEEAAEDCDRGVRKLLKKARRKLENVIEDDGGDDDDRRPRRKKIKCWTKGDPGCEHTKNGRPPMTRSAFNSLMSAVKASKPHIFPMVDQVRSSMSNQYMTSRQLKRLVPVFKPHTFQMLDVVKICAPKLVDPQNGSDISALFQPHVFQGQDAAKIIAAQRGD